MVFYHTTPRFFAKAQALHGVLKVLASSHSRASKLWESSVINFAFPFYRKDLLSLLFRYEKGVNSVKLRSISEQEANLHWVYPLGITKDDRRDIEPSADIEIRLKILFYGIYDWNCKIFINFALGNLSLTSVRRISNHQCECTPLVLELTIITNLHNLYNL